jgi:hypothetical protein
MLLKLIGFSAEVFSIAVLLIAVLKAYPGINVFSRNGLYQKEFHFICVNPELV